MAGLFSVYHLALYGCKALPRQDDAHDTFTRTFNFVQLRKTEKSRDQAEKMLYAAAAKSPTAGSC